MNAIENVFGMMKLRYRGICPARNDDRFDYRQTFINVINTPHDFAPYFRRVRDFVQHTIDTGALEYTGYG